LTVPINGKTVTAENRQEPEAHKEVEATFIIPARPDFG
jgi:hypothetical protein